MQKSYIVKATLCMEDCQFFLRAGDMIVYDGASQRLTVYRNNDIVKILKQSPLGVAALQKTGILQEPPTPTAPVKVAPPKPSDAVLKRQKAVPKEVLISDSPRLMEALSTYAPEKLIERGIEPLPIKSESAG